MVPVYALNGDDCVPAALASVLELPLDHVPHFVRLHGSEAWWREMNLWLTAMYDLTCLAVHNEPHGFLPPVGYHILSGVNVEGNGHVVVAFNGKIVHDPDPEGRGILAGQDEYAAWLFVKHMGGTPAWPTT